MNSQEHADFRELGFAEKKFYDFPNIINLEVFRGQCPCSCIHCPVGIVNQNDRPARFGIKSIRKDVLEKIVKEMKAHSHSTLRLHSVGDPVIWEGLIETINYIHASGITSWIFTSLLTHNTTIIEQIAENCDIIEVSVNSIESQDYKNTKGVDAFNLVCDNIKYLHSYILRRGLTTRLVVSRVQSNSPQQDKDFIEYWKNSGYVADAFVRQYHTYNDILCQSIEQKETKLSCLVHWMRFNISCDGLVLTCFNELFRDSIREDVIVGNLCNSSIQQIWQGEFLNNLRKAELSGYVDGNFSHDFPCRNCKSCQAYDNKHDTSEVQVNALNKRRVL